MTLAEQEADARAALLGNQYHPTRFHTRLYLASPYTQGDKSKNVRKSLEMADRLMAAGYAVYAPLLTHFQDLVFPRPANDWLGLDLAWLSVSDVMFRMPGKSNGADIEEAFANRRGIPVVRSLAALDGWRSAHTILEEA